MEVRFKAKDILDEVDILMPNQYSSEIKLGWLSQLDGSIFDELIKTHHPMPCKCDFKPYESDDTELLIPYPYGKDVYTFYLQAKIAAQNSEVAKANQYSAQYNAAYQIYSSYYNRNHMPVGRADKRFHF